MCVLGLIVCTQVRMTTCFLPAVCLFWIKGQKHVEEFQMCLKDVTECLRAETSKMLSARSDLFVVIYSQVHMK